MSPEEFDAKMNRAYSEGWNAAQLLYSDAPMEMERLLERHGIDLAKIVELERLIEKQKSQISQNKKE